MEVGGGPYDTTNRCFSVFRKAPCLLFNLILIFPRLHCLRIVAPCRQLKTLVPSWASFDPGLICLSFWESRVSANLIHEVIKLDVFRKTAFLPFLSTAIIAQLNLILQQFILSLKPSAAGFLHSLAWGSVSWSFLDKQLLL